MLLKTIRYSFFVWLTWCCILTWWHGLRTATPETPRLTLLFLRRSLKPKLWSHWLTCGPASGIITAGISMLVSFSSWQLNGTLPTRPTMVLMTRPLAQEKEGWRQGGFDGLYGDHLFSHEALLSSWVAQDINQAHHRCQESHLQTVWCCTNIWIKNEIISLLGKFSFLQVYIHDPLHVCIMYLLNRKVIFGKRYQPKRNFVSSKIDLGSTLWFGSFILHKLILKFSWHVSTSVLVMRKFALNLELGICQQH